MSDNEDSGGPFGGFESLFKEFLEKLPQIRDRMRREPATVIHEIDEKIKEEIELNPDAGKRVWKHLFGGELARELPVLHETLRARYEQDRRAHALIEFLDDADRQVPYLTFVTALGFTKTESITGMVDALNPLEIARREKGEVQARALMFALDAVAERLYRPYLSAIYRIDCFARKTTPEKRVSTVGALVHALRSRIPADSPLIDPDAGWLRNSAAHGHWNYVPADGVLMLWDESRPKTRFEVADLLARVENMATTNKVFRHVMMTRVVRHQLELSHVYSVHRDGMISPDPEVRKRAFEAADGAMPPPLLAAWRLVGLSDEPDFDSRT